MSEPAPSSSRAFQFRLATLFTIFVYTGVALALILHVEAGGLLVFVSAPLLMAPTLARGIRRAPNGICFSLTERILLTVLVGGHSMLMLALSAVMTAEWKGGKGDSALYYVLDGWSGVTLWPLYGWGIYMFIHTMRDERSENFLKWALLAVAGNTVISFYYTFACLFLNFAQGAVWATGAPLSAGACYLLFAMALGRRLRALGSSGLLPLGALATWVSLWVCSLAAKIPLTLRYYHGLPDKPPESCFIVTAASRGHHAWVGSWIDPESQQWTNRQLLVMRHFESLLQRHTPWIHRVLRRWYDWLAPGIANRIRHPWQADIVYVLLKPVEWIAAMANRLVEWLVDKRK